MFYYVYSTVWYELLCGEYPFKSQPPEAVIWQVGKGVKQSLANMQASRDIKVQNLSLLYIFLNWKQDIEINWKVNSHC